MAQLGHVWTQVPLSMRKLVLCGDIWRRSWAQEKPNVGNVASYEHHQSQKTLEMPNWAQLAQTWAQVALSPSGHVGLELGPSGPNRFQIEGIYTSPWSSSRIWWNLRDSFMSNLQHHLLPFYVYIQLCTYKHIIYIDFHMTFPFCWLNIWVCLKIGPKFSWFIIIFRKKKKKKNAPPILRHPCSLGIYFFLIREAIGSFHGGFHDGASGWDGTRACANP